jgi:ribosomal protein S18 acetylase RimI-like enzyme
MTHTYTIRPAIPADSNAVARLTYLTMGIEADWLFGQGKGYSSLDVLVRLFLRQGNRVSYDKANVIEQDGKVAGLIIAYPGKMLLRMNNTTAWHILQMFGLAATIRLITRQPAYGDLNEAESDEFYISNLAVFPEFQRLGIGKRLMVYAEELARASGLQKCSLIVSFGHENARHMYEQLGYKTVQTYSIMHPQVAEGSGGYHRMVKTLSMDPDIG